MCTVTYIPRPDGYLLTFSRDEKPGRLNLPPARQLVNEDVLCFPKDMKGGGTWIAADDKGRVACLFNGGFNAHCSTGNYRKSRGLVLLERFSFETPDSFTENVSLDGIEPFSLLMIETKPEGIFFDQLVWDGNMKYISKLNSTESMIWSSSTLYSKEIRQMREKLFKKWIEKHDPFEDKNILAFHSNSHGLCSENDIRMERKNGIQTVSISQINAGAGKTFFLYTDLLTGNQTELNINDK